ARTGEAVGNRGWNCRRRTCGSVVFVSLKILKMSGIENCADRKGPIEIRLVGTLGQATDEHCSWVAGAEVEGGRCCYGNNVAGTRSAGDANRPNRGIGEIHGRELTGP